MPGLCEGRVAIVTGAGRGIGREHALMLAEQGAKVVVNDLGGDDGRHRAVDRPGAATSSTRSRRWAARPSPTATTSPTGRAPQRLINRRSRRSAASTSLVNNAGILRDRMLVEHDRGGVGRGHQGPPQGHVRPVALRPPPTGASRSKAGETIDGRIINTTSASGIYGNAGQTNYGAAKAGIAAFTIIAAMELGRYGVTVNAIAPAALTRMTEDLGMGQADEETKEQHVAALDRPDRHLAGVDRVGRRHRAGVRGVGPACSASPRAGTAARASSRSTTRPARRRSSPTCSPRPARTPTWTATTPSKPETGDDAMPINPDAVGAKGEPVEHLVDVEGRPALRPRRRRRRATSWRSPPRTPPTSPQQVLPTMAVVLGVGRRRRRAASIGTFNPAMLVHGEQAIDAAPARSRSRARSAPSSEITGIYDKGKARGRRDRVDVDRRRRPASRCSRRACRRSSAARAAGAATAARRAPRNVPPERAPDHAVTYQTPPDQALLYRLSGDRNPLHSDPSFAAMGGFDRPILHGLCTYGFTGRALLHSLCDSDPTRFTAMEGRFSSPVLPGEALTVDMWVDGDGEAVLRRPSGAATATRSISSSSIRARARFS